MFLGYKKKVQVSLDAISDTPPWLNLTNMSQSECFEIKSNNKKNNLQN